MKDLGIADELADYELATSFTWNGGTYAGALGDVTESDDLGIGGFAGASDQVLVAASAQFATKPAQNDTVTVGSKVMRIKEITTSPCGTFYVFNLTDPTRGV